MAVTVETFKARFPEFADTDDARCQVYLDDATAMCSPDFWGNLLNLAISYLAGHMVSVSLKSEEDSGDPKAQGIIRERIDVLEVAYSDSLIAESARNEYKGSPYGQRYLGLLQRMASSTASGV